MKEVEWGTEYGCGEIVCECDYCSETTEHEFEDGSPDFRGAQEHIRDLGWTSTKVNGHWHDFCSEDCRNSFIKEHA